jgi:hypothetical protein
MMIDDALVAQIRRLPPLPQHVLGCLVRGEDQSFQRRVLSLLWMHGLLDRQTVTTPSSVGTPSVVRYTVPPAVSAAWQAWQAARRAGRHAAA